jgi:hypothetical protein
MSSGALSLCIRVGASHLLSWTVVNTEYRASVNETVDVISGLLAREDLSPADKQFISALGDFTLEWLESPDRAVPDGLYSRGTDLGMALLSWDGNLPGNPVLEPGRRQALGETLQLSPAFSMVLDGISIAHALRESHTQGAFSRIGDYFRSVFTWLFIRPQTSGGPKCTLVTARILTCSDGISGSVASCLDAARQKLENCKNSGRMEARGIFAGAVGFLGTIFGLIPKVPKIPIY